MYFLGVPLRSRVSFLGDRTACVYIQPDNKAVSGACKSLAMTHINRCYVRFKAFTAIKDTTISGGAGST